MPFAVLSNYILLGDCDIYDKIPLDENGHCLNYVLVSEQQEMGQHLQSHSGL